MKTQTLQTMGSAVIGFRHELWEEVEDNGTPHCQGFWRITTTAYMNRVTVIYAQSVCPGLSSVFLHIVCISRLCQGATGSTTRRNKALESSTWWPYSWFRHCALSSRLFLALVGLTSVLVVFHNDSHLWFKATFYDAKKWPFNSTESRLWSPCPHFSRITCLFTPPCRWFLPSFFLPYLWWVFATHTFCWF